MTVAPPVTCTRSSTLVATVHRRQYDAGKALKYDANDSRSPGGTTMLRRSRTSSASRAAPAVHST